MLPSGTGVGDSLGWGPAPMPSARRRAPGLFSPIHRCRFHTFSFLFCFFFSIPQSSEGLHSVSSRDNGVPSVTTARITEHNGGRAAVMPAQGRPTGSSCSRLSSDGSRVFQATCDLLPAATSACFTHVAPPREQKSVFPMGTINISTTN